MWTKHTAHIMIYLFKLWHSAIRSSMPEYMKLQHKIKVYTTYNNNYNIRTWLLWQWVPPCNGFLLFWEYWSVPNNHSKILNHYSSGSPHNAASICLVLFIHVPTKALELKLYRHSYAPHTSYHRNAHFDNAFNRQ